MELSARERESLALAMSGRTNREIARALRLSPAQVRSDLFAVAAKIGASARDDMIVAARRLLLDGSTESGEVAQLSGEPDARIDR
ncbi:MAG: LuxR C-terminal-related transcriptional regulator [Dehalococcoidia bacterium]